MPAMGRPSKPAGQRVNRAKLIHEWTEVPNVPFAGGPALPRKRADGSAWPARTREKWETWRALPHAKLWGPAEWDYALDSIELAAQFHTGDSKAATELRNREKVIGTTLDYQRAIRIRLIDPDTAKDRPAAVSNIDDYRAI